MEDMEQKLNAFLTDPEAMEKVMGMARSLGFGGKTPPPARHTRHAPPDPPPERAAEGKSSGDGLGAMLGSLQNMDPKMLSGLMGLMETYNGGGDRREALLLSLKPYLRDERKAKLDRAAQMMRIARTARLGLKTFLGGEQNA